MHNKICEHFVTLYNKTKNDVLKITIYTFSPEDSLYRHLKERFTQIVLLTF